MPRKQDTDKTPADIPARIVKAKHGFDLVRCGRCGARLTALYTGALRPIGYIFDGRVWREATRRRAERERDQRLVTTGRATAADRNRLVRNDYGRTGGGTHDRWVQEADAERYQLPQRMVCGPCGAENLIDGDDLVSPAVRNIICRTSPEAARLLGIAC
jgi:hypothetical protein